MISKNYLNRRKLYYTFLLLFALFLFVSCASTHRYKYSLENIQKLSKSHFSQYNLLVKLKDERKDIVPAQKRLDSNLLKREDKNGDDWYFNLEGKYEEGSASNWIRKLMIRHLNASKLFKKVQSYKGVDCTSYFILEGDIITFQGLTEYSSSAVTAAQFGLIGALVGSGIKAGYEAEIELKNFKLIEMPSNKIVWEGTIKKRIEGLDSADVYGWQAFQKADLSLKMAVNEIINQITNVSFVKDESFLSK